MSCIKKEVFQRCIDSAASEEETEAARKHLAVCRECTDQLAALQHRSDEVKKALNILVSEEVPIPGFIAPARIPNVLAATRLRRYALSLVAASVLAGIVLAVVFTVKTPARQQIVVMHTVDREINANQTITKQQLVINVIDANMKVTVYQLK
ncbi:MAG: hypothetical protein WCK34_10445 [Bacteroidota bacterium]